VKIEIGSAWPAVAIALTLALGGLAGGCGGSSDVTLTIGARNTAEETILGQIYAKALEAAGYTVKTNVITFGQEVAATRRALERGRISGFPEHLSTALTTFDGRKLEEVPADPQKAFMEADASFEKDGLKAFPPTSLSLTNAVGVLKKMANERGLKTVSDLRGQSEELTIAGAFGCHEQINCVEGLERLYGLTFAGFVFKFGSQTEPFHWLESKLADLAMLPTTDGRLFTEKDTLVTLKEDKHLFPANNAIFVTTQKVVEEAGPKFEEAIVTVQKGLTVRVMQELDAKVEIGKQDPAEVAAEYVKQTGLATRR
jgi:osmoprotectant transport system substrate-binding protein